MRFRIIFVFFIFSMFVFSEEKKQIKNYKDKIYKIKLATSWPPNLSFFSDVAINFKKNIELMTNKRIQIRIDNANKTKAPFGVFDLVKSGQYEMGHSASHYYYKKDVNTIYFTTMPFGMLPIEQYSWFYYGGGLELMNEVYNKHNLYSFLGGNTGAQMGGWFRKEIKTLDDLKGLKIRIPGFGGEILAKLGATVVNIAPGELYTAMDRGTIDAVEWVGPKLDLKLGLHKIANFYYGTWQEPSGELQFLVNKKFMDSLPKDLQEIMKQAMKLSAYEALIQSAHENAKSWHLINKDYSNIKIKIFPKEVLNAMQEAYNDILQKKTKDNPMSQKIIKSQRDYLKKIRNWTLISDYSYLKHLKD